VAACRRRAGACSRLCHVSVLKRTAANACGCCGCARRKERSLGVSAARTSVRAHTFPRPRASTHTMEPSALSRRSYSGSPRVSPTSIARSDVTTRHAGHQRGLAPTPQQPYGSKRGARTAPMHSLIRALAQPSAQLVLFMTSKASVSDD
jgi:hypothetical protein